MKATDRSDRRAGIAIAFAAVAIAVTITFDALHTYLSTRPGPRIVFAAELTPTRTGTQGSLDAVLLNGRPNRSRPVIARAGDVVTISGWGVDADAHAPLAAVFSVLDDGDPARARFPIQRPDVAAALHCACAASGYRITIDAGALTPGTHRVLVRYALSDGLHAADGPFIEVARR